MPEALKYVSDVNSKEWSSIEDAYRKEVQRRQREYKEGWKYYYGDHKKHLTEDGTGTDDNIMINLVELAIDKGVSSLMGTTEQGVVKGPDFDVVLDDTASSTVQRAARAVRKAVRVPAQKSEQQAYLDKVWEANGKSLLLHDLAVNGGICGTLFLKIVPEGIADPDDDTKRLPRLIVINPGNIAPFWDASDVDRTLWWRIQYGQDGKRKRQDIVRNLDDDGLDARGWTIYDWQEGVKDKRGWSLISETVWDHNWPPIVEWKNFPRPNERYGLDDIRNNDDLNDGLNFTASNTQRIIKNYAHPNTIGTGIKAGEILPSSIGRLWTVQSPDAKIFNLEMQSDLSSSMNFMHFIRRSFFNGVRELDPDTVQDKLGALTNFGLRVLFRDTLEKVGTKRLLYGHGLRNTSRYILDLGGYPNTKVKDVWPDPLPQDNLVQAQSLVLDRQNGLSQETYLSRRGYDPIAEAQNRENEMGAEVFKQGVTNQASFMDSLRKGIRGGNNGQPDGQQLSGLGRGGNGANGNG